MSICDFFNFTNCNEFDFLFVVYLFICIVFKVYLYLHVCIDVNKLFIIIVNTHYMKLYNFELLLFDGTVLTGNYIYTLVCR